MHRSAEDSPEIIILDRLSARYEPVEFAHRAHAAMSEISDGCAICHHHETGGEISACGDCHQATMKGADLGQPTLKGSYHRQCLGCHRAWSHSTACSICHLRTGGTGETDAEAESADEAGLAVDTTDIVGVDHPPIEQPRRVVYETDPDVGPYVTFYHDDHVDRFGLPCSACHKAENCGRCHDAATRKERRASLPLESKEEQSFDDAHAPCISCHGDDDCQECHQERPRDPFDHAASTGWPLRPYHREEACRECHGEYEQFRTPSRSCDGCHGGWHAGTFEHAVTGLTLDEVHRDLDCELCHENRDFSQDPGCQYCHDDRGYPKDTPGTVTEPGKTE
jgi:hypothetical protein